MTASRREFIGLAGIGLGGVAALVAGDRAVLAQTKRDDAGVPAPDTYKASTAERAVRVVNLNLVEA